MSTQTQTRLSNKSSLQEARNKLFKPLLYFLIALHFFGFLGMHWDFMNEQLQALTPFKSFISLTPLNLMLTSVMLLFFHEDWQPAFFLFAVLAMLTGFFAEVAGVATGLIFGEYSYGATLGWKLWDVPLVIGVNWFLLSYVCCSILPFQNKLKRTIAAALLMVLLDLLIEPVAIKYDFWTWAAVDVPLQNYIAWFIIALVPCGLFCYLPFSKFNRFAIYVFWAQLLFFAANNMLI